MEADFTHAFLPRDACDEVVTVDGHVCAKLEDAYLSLRATTPLSWAAPDDDVTDLLPYDSGDSYEPVTEGGRTTWV